jgi:hypothetical protein
MFEEDTLFCGEGTNLRTSAKKISGISGINEFFPAVPQ